ncbi:uncharacterized protein [Panulirus ornatus]|uniref:uncharacterized protein n=1 Tax=Panulirus ornatus TaxID=150431 RepID=UPI003A8A559D
MSVEPPEPLVVRVEPATVYRGPPEAYINASEPRGAIFIANYRHFDGGQETREGSEHDVKNLRDLFTQLGYESIGNLDSVTKEETVQALQRFRDDEIHKRVDSLVVIFMSHGCDKDTFCTTDGKTMSYEEVCSMFNNVNCPALLGKPKLFIFQFCRGGKEHIPISNYEICAASIDNPRIPRKRSEREVSEVFLCFSALPGFVSYRHKDYGSPFIDKVCRVFMNNAKDKNLDGLMRKVNRELPSALAMDLHYQAVRYEFFFNPPAFREEEDGRATKQAGIPVEPPSIHGTEDTYKNFSVPRGLVLIVNNLPGCQEDVDKLTYIFSELGYQVLQPFLDLTHTRLIEEFEAFKQKNHKDSAIVIFYGDGFEDCLVTSDRKILTFRELMERFNDIRCPNLEGKPKIFMLNTCYYNGPIFDSDQGVTFEAATPSSCSAVSPDCTGWTADGDVADAGRLHELQIPAERDMILFSVEVEGGRCDGGSLLTDALFQILLSSDLSLEISSLLRRVCRRLDDLQGCSERKGEKYFPEVRSIKVGREFYFNPPKLVTPDTPRSPFSPARPRDFRRMLSYPTIRVKEAQQPMGDESYTNWSKPRGLALIVSYGNYESEGLPNWHRRKKDAHWLFRFMRDVGYKTERHSNVSYEEMKVLLQDFRNRREHLEVDSMIFVVLGFVGDENTFLNPSGAAFRVDDIYQHFTDSACPALKGKPKIFFFHMTNLHDWQQSAPLSPLNEVRDAFVLRLISKANPNPVLQPSKGLQALQQALKDHAHDTHLERIVTMVEEHLDTSHKVICQYGHFQKKFYFNPKKAKD